MIELKLKLSDLVEASRLVTIDACDVVKSRDGEIANTIYFELAGGEFTTLVNDEVYLNDKTDEYSFKTVDGNAVACEFYMNRNIRVADIMKLASIRAAAKPVPRLWNLQGQDSTPQS